jgi:hypothetical protein
MYRVQTRKKIVPSTIPIDHVPRAGRLAFAFVAELDRCRCSVVRARAFDGARSKKLDPSNERHTTRLHERKKLEV